jgi:hypothetical protein
MDRELSIVGKPPSRHQPHTCSTKTKRHRISTSPPHHLQPPPPSQHGNNIHQTATHRNLHNNTITTTPYHLHRDKTTTGAKNNLAALQYQSPSTEHKQPRRKRSKQKQNKIETVKISPKLEQEETKTEQTKKKDKTPQICLNHHHPLYRRERRKDTGKNRTEHKTRAPVHKNKTPSPETESEQTNSPESEQTNSPKMEQTNSPEEEKKQC